MQKLIACAGCIVLLSLLLTACGEPAAISTERLAAVDSLAERVKQNVVAAGMTQVADIDHARLGAQAGSVMPPARVIIFSNAELEARLMAINPLIGVDLPLRALAYEPVAGDSANLIYNRFDYLVSRYQLDSSKVEALRQSYDQSMQAALDGVGSAAIAGFGSDQMQPDGIITLASPYDFQQTVTRVNAAIDAQDDTMHFGVVDFQAAARKESVEIEPALLVLFGGPGPGGKAMAQAPTLGLDGFCQKFLIWQDAQGKVFLSYNDLLALAERQGADTAIALRVINFRLNKVFADALMAEG